jgi:hypothetical protein
MNSISRLKKNQNLKKKKLKTLLTNRKKNTWRKDNKRQISESSKSLINLLKKHPSINSTLTYSRM